MRVFESKEKKMSNKQIAPERWGEFFEQVSNNNQGRRIKLEIVNPVRGDQIQFENSPLLSLIYDSVNTGILFEIK